MFVWYRTYLFYVITASLGMTLVACGGAKSKSRGKKQETVNPKPTDDQPLQLCDSEASDPDKDLDTNGYLQPFVAGQIIPGGAFAIVGSDRVTVADDPSKTESVTGRFQVSLLDPDKLTELSTPARGTATPDLSKFIVHRKLIAKAESKQTFELPNFGTGGSHLTFGFNPKYSEGPMPVRTESDCRKGILGMHETRALDCYRLIMYFSKATPKSGPKVLPYAKFEIQQAEVLIVIDKNAKKIALAEFVSEEESPYQPIRHPTSDKPFFIDDTSKCKKEPNRSSSCVNSLEAQGVIDDAAKELSGSVQGIELTTTADSRLLIYGPTHIKPGACYPGNQFIFNETPWDSTKWTATSKISNIHECGTSRTFRQSAPGFVCLGERDTSGVCPSQIEVKFDERYPIAKHPMKMPDNVTTLKDQSTSCNYPWINADGSEIFCQLLRNDGLAVIGESTKGVYKLIDGFFNLQPSPREMPAGQNSIISLGTGSGTWKLFQDKELPLPIPATGRKSSQILLTRTAGNNVIYGEADTHDFTDGNYLLYLQMNRLVEFCGPEVCPNSPFDRSFHYDPTGTKTPDTSGEYHIATLKNGARFTTGEVYKTAPDSGNLARIFKGSAVVFPRGSSIEVTPKTTSASINDARSVYTIQFALKPRLTLGTGEFVAVAEKAGSWKISLREKNQIYLELWLKQSASPEAPTHRITVGPIPNEITERAWTHVSIELAPTREGARFNSAINIYLNGERLTNPGSESGSFRLKDLNLPDGDRRYELVGNNNPIILGPTNLSPSTDAVFVMDEFALSRTRRTPQEIRLAALRPARPPEFQQNTLDKLRLPPTCGVFLGSKPLPKGLNATELSIPDALLPYVNNQDAINLGATLFQDKNLSAPNSQFSCQSCHDPSKAFTDGKSKAIGAGVGTLNTPTILNRAFSTSQFFDGKSSSLLTQALKPITNPVEMNANMNDVMNYLRKNFDARFHKVFNGPPTEERLALALAAFEVSLVSANSAADNLWKGLPVHLRSSALKGQALFDGKARCAGCHSGSNLTDELAHKTGVGTTNTSTNVKAFKTPTLRSICMTGPYFHDGSATSLRSVVEFYNRGGAAIGQSAESNLDLIPLGLSNEEVNDLVFFLKTLTSSEFPINGTPLPTECVLSDN
jgi:cytochrome c peroxidase